MKKLTLLLKKRAFYYILISIPLIQFAIFYLGVNINSILLAFKEYDVYTGEHSIIWFDNFKQVFADFTSQPALLFALKNSLILYFLTTVIGISLALLFSYYIYKKGMLSGLFQVILYLPSIVSSLAFVLIYKYFAELAIPNILGDLFGVEIKPLLSNPDTEFGTILFFCLWTSFGVNIIMYSNAMSGISDSIIEAAQLDGCNAIKEFFYIVIPRIWSTVTVFITVGLATLFTNQMNLFSFHGIYAEPKIWTIGYYLYKEVADPNTKLFDYPYLAAFGLVLTVVAVPITLGVRILAEKFGPKDN